MKRIILSLLFAFFCLHIYSIDKQALADTLSSIVSEHAYAGKVAVSRVRVRNQQIFVYTNATLSHISLTPQEVRDLRLLISQLVLGNNQGKVSIYSGELELGELITSVHKARPANMRYTLNQVPAWVRNVSFPYSAPNGLSGKHIALWGSHGRYYHQTMEQWLWQRAKLWTTVEDVYTSSYTMPFLVPMLENAGAVVVQPRERDTQEVEDVVDEQRAVQSGSTLFSIVQCCSILLFENLFSRKRSRAISTARLYVTICTPAAYQRRSLQRPSMEI